jgi:hypothetical protein
MDYLTTKQFCDELEKKGVVMKIPNLTRIIKAGKIEAKKASHSFSDRFRYMIPRNQLEKFTTV